MKKIWRSRGFTLIEILVAAGIVVALAGIIFKMITRAGDTRAFATARGIAKDQTEIVLRALERDITSARSEQVTEAGTNNKKMYTTFKRSGTDTIWTVELPGTTSTTVVNVTYTYDATARTISRKNDGPSSTDRVLANNVEVFNIDIQYPSKVLVEIKIGVVPDGRQVKVFHEQKMLMTTASSVNADNRWKGADTIINNY